MKMIRYLPTVLLFQPQRAAEIDASNDRNATVCLDVE
jgi:hypothetical protein